MQTATSSYLKGVVCGLAAVSIWAGWSALTRLAVTTKLDAWDITALRFGVPALLLLPVVFRRGKAVDGLSWPALLLLVAGGGAPFVLLSAPDYALRPLTIRRHLVRASRHCSWR